MDFYTNKQWHLFSKIPYTVRSRYYYIHRAIYYFRQTNDHDVPTVVFQQVRLSPGRLDDHYSSLRQI